MSRPDLDERALALRAERAPFVRARVVLAQRPTSAKPGDEAILHPDGTIEGFVGGTCAESTVRAEGLALLESRQSLLLRITPDASPAAETTPGTRTVHNPCLSGGALEIFLEPVVPAPTVAVLGSGPIASALATVAAAMEYRCVAYAAGDAARAEAVILASHGRDELPALIGALEAGVPYVALVASRRRGAAVLAELAADRPDLDTSRVRTPAGLDIGARTAPEVAVSILAEIIQARRAPAVAAPRAPSQTAATRTAIDPVCGMTVAAVDASLHLDRDGTRIYFCGPGCLRAFSAHD